MNTFDTNNVITLSKMKDNIASAGGLFYQYRPCRRDEATIYDIENIRHGVVYSQTPLNMNDPFDSLIAFSPDSILDECITMVVEATSLTDESHKLLFSHLLRHKTLGTLAEYVNSLSKLKQYIISKQHKMHLSHLSYEQFIKQNFQSLFKSAPKDLKRLFPEPLFLFLSLSLNSLNTSVFTEEDILQLFKADEIVGQLENTVKHIRDTQYMPLFRDFLSKLTVSCFSASGWDNQLMWAHYANSYSGICIEYDFSKINDFIGFIYPVEYNKRRPKLSMRDLGVDSFSLQAPQHIVQCPTDLSTIISYLLVKNSCWEYEREWRIINVSEPYAPTFIELPYIKSITFGLKMDPLCKQLLWDVCQEKSIPCYQIMLNTENYQLSRELIEELNEPYTYDQDVQYIELLGKQFEDASEKLAVLAAPFNSSNSTDTPDFSTIHFVLSHLLDMISNAYYLKTALNRMCAHATEEELASLKVPPSIPDTISKIDEFNANVLDNVAILESAFPGLLWGHRINRCDHDKMIKDAANIKELIERFNSLKWHAVFSAQNPIAEQKPNP